MACSKFNRLKIVSIVAAFLHIFVFVIIIVCRNNISVLNQVSKHLDEIRVLNILAVLLLNVFYVVNIIMACCYIYSAILNDPKYMSFYGLILLTNVVFLVLEFGLKFIVLAVCEFYICCCTMSLRKECKNLIQKDPETPPPSYNSCANDTNIPLAEPSSNDQNNCETSPQIVPDPHVDPLTALSESTRSNGSGP